MRKRQNRKYRPTLESLLDLQSTIYCVRSSQILTASKNLVKRLDPERILKLSVGHIVAVVV